MRHHDLAVGAMDCRTLQWLAVQLFQSSASSRVTLRKGMLPIDRATPERGI
jgi:hypothetical protein